MINEPRKEDFLIQVLKECDTENKPLNPLYVFIKKKHLTKGRNKIL